MFVSVYGLFQTRYHYVFTWDPGWHGREDFRQVERYRFRHLFFGAINTGAYEVTILMSGNDSVCLALLIRTACKDLITHCISYIIARSQIIRYAPIPALR